MSRYESLADVRRFTKRYRFKTIAEKLRERGIQFTEAADGEPLVPLGALDGKPRSARNTGPRLDLVNG
jgi:hypothetical protein